MQRHLNLSRTPDRIMYEAQPGALLVGICPRNGSATERRILEDEILWDVQAGSVSQIKYVQTIPCGDPLRNLRQLDDGKIRSLLPRLPEDIALPSCERGLERII